MTRQVLWLTATEGAAPAVLSTRALLAERPGKVDGAPAPPRPAAQDLVRVYLRQVGRSRPLTAAQEREIGQRIEAGQADLRRALGAIPLVIRKLAHLIDDLRTQKASLHDLLIIVVSDGSKSTPEQILTAFAQIKRLERQVKDFQAKLKDRCHSASTRATYRRLIAEDRAAAQEILAGLPIRS